MACCSTLLRSILPSEKWAFSLSGADPGFPFGGGTDVRHGGFLAKTYAKTKELGPVGDGGAPWFRQGSYLHIALGPITWWSMI